MTFQEILQELDIPIAPDGHHHAREGWINIDCPYCGRDSNKWHLGISIEYTHVSCWRCGSHRLINTLMEISGKPYHEIKRMLGDIERIHIKREKPLGRLAIPEFVKDLQYAHCKYLLDRDFDLVDLLSLWNIKGIGLASRLSWRIFIPIIYHGETVSWTTRAISDHNQPRYISAGRDEEAMPHKELLYGEDYARHAIIIVEGPTDVWRIGPGAVATMGTGYSPQQVERMLKYPVRAVCFDSESEAQKRARKLCDELEAFPGETMNIGIGSTDPAEMNEEQVGAIRQAIFFE